MKNENVSYERYQRQIILKEFGITGQQKLSAAKVLVIGAGGLGCAILQYLAAAGTGTIGIADDDVVSLTNLHRQVLYSTSDIGSPKAETAKNILAGLNPEINFIAYNIRITSRNALNIIGSYDIVLDGTDNFASRYLVNDACVILGKPLVYGAVSKFEGQVAVFNYQNTNGDMPVNYRDLFPQPVTNDEVLNCAMTGVLGVLPGIIGTMQANETIKLITGIGTPLVNSLLTFNALNNQLYEVSLSARKETRSLIPATAEEFMQTDYDVLCASTEEAIEIDSNVFDDLCNKKGLTIIDVREEGELPVPTGLNYTQLPLSRFKEKMGEIKSETVVVFCQSGVRSLQAARWLSDEFGGAKKIYSLQGGIVKWISSQSTQNV